MLKILQDRLQQFVNRTPRCSNWILKRQGTRNQIANIRWFMEKAIEFQKNIYFCFIDYAKAFDCVRSDQISRSVVYNSLQPHESQHARPPCPPPTPGGHPKPTSIESVMPSSHLILCHPLLLLPPIPPSIRVFSNESILRMR